MAAAGKRPVSYASQAAPDAPVRTIEVYEDGAGDWRYRVKAVNGLTVGDSGQGYARKDGALRAARREHPPRPRIR